MDTEEMYRRGFADGERDDLHPFYYEHYYHYRRGYDRARKHNRQPQADGNRSFRRPLMVVLCAAVIVGGGLLLLRSRAQSQTAALTVHSATAAAVRIAVPTSTPVLPTNTPIPSPTVPPVVLHVDGRAIVTNKQGLNGRQKPGLKGVVKAKFKVGEQVQVREGPVDVDGYTWWRLESKSGVGWSAQQSKDGEIWLQADPN